LGRRVGAADDEVARLRAAVRTASVPLAKLIARASGPAQEILAAQREMLDDPDLHDRAAVLIQEGARDESAVKQVVEEYASILAALPDSYLAARADDVREAGQRLVAALQGVSLEIDLEEPAVLVAEDLTPAQLVGARRQSVLGVAIEHGTPTGHVAIVAQGLGIPAIVGVTGLLDVVHHGDTVIVDGNTGTITVNPASDQLQAVEEQRAARHAQERELARYRHSPGRTADGVQIGVYANVSSLAEAQRALEMGAEGVGLFRTELLLHRGLPEEDEQVQIYAAVAATLRRPVVIRTFDIGADKPVPGLALPDEANPFLGWRGIRLALDRSDQLFLPQVRAIMRAAADHDIRLMLPMVTTPEEVAEARALIDRAAQDLEKRGDRFRRVLVGIMVETPAAALTLDHFVDLVDFASVGTNDLAQYTYAVDRTNERAHKRAQPMGKAMLRLLGIICRGSIPVAVCGQLAAEPIAIPLLVGLGVRELSVPPARVPEVKHVLATMTLRQSERCVRQALSAS